MTAIIYDNRSSSIGPYLYNERKVYAGQAEVSAVRNLPSDDGGTILMALTALEENPAVVTQARHLAFHMGVNPGEDDAVGDDEEKMLEIIDELMAGLGYAEQPYVVYRHKDIERDHYHILSTRVRPDGHLISNSYNHCIAMRILGSLAERYGFSVGRKRNGGPVLPETEEKLDRTSSNKVLRIGACVDEALGYPLRSEQDFRAVLLSMGIYSCLNTPGGCYFSVADEAGRQAGRCIYERTLHRNVSGRLEERIAKTLSAPSVGTDEEESQRWCRIVALEALDRLDEERDVNRLAQAFNECGFHLIADIRQGRLRSCRLVDRKRKAVISLEGRALEGEWTAGRDASQAVRRSIDIRGTDSAPFFSEQEMKRMRDRLKGASDVNKTQSQNKSLL